MITTISHITLLEGQYQVSVMPRKRVAQNVLDAVPEPKDHEKVVQMERAVGKHLYEVRFPNGELTLCRMPPKFRNIVYIKRGTWPSCAGIGA